MIFVLRYFVQQMKIPFCVYAKISFLLSKNFCYILCTFIQFINENNLFHKLPRICVIHFFCCCSRFLCVCVCGAFDFLPPNSALPDGDSALSLSRAHRLRFRAMVCSFRPRSPGAKCLFCLRSPLASLDSPRTSSSIYYISLEWKTNCIPKNVA